MASSVYAYSAWSQLAPALKENTPNASKRTASEPKITTKTKTRAKTKVKAQIKAKTVHRPSASR